MRQMSPPMPELKKVNNCAPWNPRPLGQDWSPWRPPAPPIWQNFMALVILIGTGARSNDCRPRQTGGGSLPLVLKRWWCLLTQNKKAKRSFEASFSSSGTESYLRSRYFFLSCHDQVGGDNEQNDGPDGPETGAYRFERVVAVAGLTVDVDKEIADSWLDSQWSEDSTQNRHRYAMDMRYIDWGSLSKRSPFKTSAVKRLSVHLPALPAKTGQKEAFAQSHFFQKYLKKICKVHVLV